MAFCTECGKQLGPDGICDCQKSKTVKGTLSNLSENETAQTNSETVKLSSEMTEDNSDEATVSNVNDADAAVTENDTTQQEAVTETAAKQSKKRTFIIAIAVIAVLALAVVIGIAIFKAGSYKKPVKELAKLINEQNTDIYAYRNLFTNQADYDFTVAAHKIMKSSSDYMDDYDNAVEGLEKYYEDLQGFKLSVDISKAGKLDDETIQNMNASYLNGSVGKAESYIQELQDMDDTEYEAMADEFGLSASSTKKLIKEVITYLENQQKVEITAGYEVTARFFGELNGREDKTEKFTFRVLKVNGSWYIYDSDAFMSNLHFTGELSDVSIDYLYQTVMHHGMKGLNK